VHAWKYKLAFYVKMAINAGGCNLRRPVRFLACKSLLWIFFSFDCAPWQEDCDVIFIPYMDE